MDAAASDPDVQDDIWIASTGDYEDQHVLLTDANVIIEGGFSSSAVNEPDAPATSIGGADGHSVFEFEGHSNLIITGVFLRGASLGESNKGGGIYFGGSGYIELANVTIGANTAGYGGGIDVSPDDGQSSVLRLDADVTVVNNTALVSGGGIRLEGNSRLYALQPDTWILANQAPAGYGGGVEIVGLASADIGGSRPGGGAIIDSNTDHHGGGVDIIATGEGDATLRLFTTDASKPGQISNNVAYNTGGAVYLKGWVQADVSYHSASFCARDFLIEGNSAQEGAAIYADADYTIANSQGGFIALNGTVDCGDSLAEAVACAPGIPCNRIDGNFAQQEDGTATDGSTILLQTGADLFGDRFELRSNAGGHAIRIVADDPGTLGTRALASLSNCLLVDNTVSDELITATGGDQGLFFLDDCTIAGNTIGADAVLHLPSTDDFERVLRNSIIDQPERLAIDPPVTDTSDAIYLLVTDVSTLPDSNEIALGEPTFVDRNAGNYHLMPNSLGIDFAAIDAAAGAVDLDGLTRSVDLPRRDVFGPADLGAYETQLDAVLTCALADTVFCDGFDP